MFLELKILLMATKVAGIVWDSNVDVRVGASLFVNGTTEVNKIFHVLKLLTPPPPKGQLLCSVALRLTMSSPSCAKLLSRSYLLLLLTQIFCKQTHYLKSALPFIKAIRHKT